MMRAAKPKASLVMCHVSHKETEAHVLDESIYRCVAICVPGVMFVGVSFVLHLDYAASVVLMHKTVWLYLVLSVPYHVSAERYYLYCNMQNQYHSVGRPNLLVRQASRRSDLRNRA